MRSELITANAWIVCSCGEKHRLVPGTKAPVYQCEKKVLPLKEGDKVEYEEVSSAK